jgi:hypothetical protein
MKIYLTRQLFRFSSASRASLHCFKIGADLGATLKSHWIKSCSDASAACGDAA